MIDLNHILLFVAFVSPIVLLVRLRRSPARSQRGWQTAAGLVLAITGGTYLAAPGQAGFFGGVAWFFLLLVPITGQRKLESLISRGHLRTARVIATALSFLHPWDGFVARPRMLRAMQLARGGDPRAALAALGNLDNSSATALRFSIAQDWAGLVEWYRGLRGAAAEDGLIFSAYLRALGETGARDELVREFAARRGSDADLVHVLAFCGEPEELVRLFATNAVNLSSERREFWLGTAELAAGRIEAGTRRLDALARATRDATTQDEVKRRLERGSAIPTRWSDDATTALRRTLQRRRAQPTASVPFFPSRLPAVWTFMLLNLAMFAAEFALGGTTDDRALLRLGALEPYLVIVQGQYWRVLAALFLHFGPLHIVFNLYALWVLGPPLERSIGSVRFAICYLIAGLGSNCAVLGLIRLGWTKADLLVGASGCIMGVLGATAGLLLRHRHGLLAAQRLRNIALIIVIQTAFDLSTPQVSMAAHLSGLVTGFVVGLLISAKRRAL
jgi:rhomboid protease GluP